MLPERQEVSQALHVAGIEALLLSLHVVGNQLKEADSAMERYWGQHLLEDWRTLELLADRLRHDA